MGSKDFRKRNTEFITHGNKLLQRQSVIEKHDQNERFSILEDESFFAINKIDPRLDT